jgi:tetratricopeptide (TPR) repeat protein
MCLIRACYDLDWIEAEKEGRRAVELNPNYWLAHDWYAAVLSGLGRREQAIAEVVASEELEPLLLAIKHHAAWIFTIARQPAQAIERCRKAMEIEKNYGFAHYWLGINYEQQGKYKEAVAELKKALQLMKSPSVVAGSLGHAHALAGNRDEAEKIVSNLVELSRGSYVDPFAIGQVYLGLKEVDRSFEWFNQACDVRSPFFILLLKDDPRLDCIRDDRRFENLMQRIGLNRLTGY